MKTEFAQCLFPDIVIMGERGGRRAVLNSNWTVCVGGITLVVPAGTETDGATIPRFLRCICGHPMERPRIYAALVHDWLYTRGIDMTSRKEADMIYRLLLLHFGISRTRAFIEYHAIRMFGWAHWKT